MGKWKDYAIDAMNDSEEIRIAELLGISLEELSELEYDIESDENDGFLYNYRIEFSENSPKNILDKIRRIQDGHTVYLNPWEVDNYYEYDELFDAIIDNKEYVTKFFEELDNLTKLSQLKIESLTLKQIMLRQIFISIIGTMETFLSDTFINLTNDNDEYFRNFVESHPEFKQRKFELREIFIENEKLKETAKVIMLETIYHNLPIIKEMFSNTFKMEFPKINVIYPLVLKRHDLVHRNGKTKEGNEVELTEVTIDNLINEIRDFVNKIIVILQLH